MKKRMRSACNLLSPFGVQMGHVWGISTLAYFYAIGKLLNTFSATPTKPNAPQSFFTENGA